MFHIPLFITISGYFFSLSVQKYTLITYIKKIFHRLLLPSICWGIINCIAIIINKTIHNKPIDPLYCIQIITTGLWYLTLLFILSSIGAIIHHNFNKHRWIVWGIIYLIVTFIIPYNTWSRDKKRSEICTASAVCHKALRKRERNGNNRRSGNR